MTDFSTMPGYRPGESDTRPWGKWEVLDTGTEDTTSVDIGDSVIDE